MPPRSIATSLLVGILGLLASLAQAQVQPGTASANNTVQTTVPSAATSGTGNTTAAALTTPGTISSPTNFARTNLSAIDPLAVCNDGSAGFYYYRPGTGSGTSKWVIRLEGGGWCYDQQTCVLRFSATPSLMGSGQQYYPDTLGGGAVIGILDGDPRANPNMNLWNHVSIGYCSSDSYLGDVAPGDTTETGIFQFRGQRIVNATIRSLLAANGMNTATDILFAGVSAGAVGAFSLADPVYSILQPNTPSLVNYKVVVDAGWFLDIPSYSTAASAFTFRKTAMGLFNNFKAAYDPSCMAAFPDKAWACFFAQYAWPYVETPLIFHEYLYDSANLGYDAAGGQQQVEDLRARLATSITTPANAIQGPKGGAASLAPATVSTFSVQPGPSVSSGGQSLPTLTSASAPSPTGIYAPGMQNLPPAAIPRGIPPGKSPPPVPPPPPGAKRSPPAGSMQQSVSPGLPGVSAAGTSQLPLVFSPACANHDVVDNLLFPVSKIGNVRFVDVLNKWFTTGNSSLPYVDPWVGLAPGASCLAY